MDAIAPLLLVLSLVVLTLMTYMYGTGSVYLAGLGIGGLYGAREGLKATKGSPFKIRFNGLLNGCTRRGPFLGNSLGMLALGYTSINSAADYFGAPDTSLTAIASGALTGMLFKSTAGLRSSLIAGGICSLVVSAWKLANDAYLERPVDYSRQLADA
ncbi:Mitochondrial import inner membrane translocase subunit tim23 [Entomophthora muscae]|uniref:Mitochondrial import inner membrane translocase subunit tim23 n=1 Tax=Entomophthora muscae TaxID=34485 RepID=A0ACC2T093_9FUNG|nr:Mitochondrial import inner membrane translocase subunit tim23 [Entomophthora muscae]